jgi:serine/threonine protein kinase
LADDAEIRAEERVGTVLNDKWTLERLLGVGGMAAVYAGRHRNGARAAVKVLHSDLSRHPEIRERFLREGYAANSVEHPGAVKVLDDDVVVGGPDAGTAYLVMELLEGESLQEHLERGHLLSEREFLAVAESVLEVLEVAHARGVVHRDLKPENLFLLSGHDEQGSGAVRVKVLDFGLARLLQGQAITSYGLALGTPSFMSPEQAAGRIDEIDGRTDLFALAATGFRLRAGRRIHEGINPVELVTKMANVAAPRIRTLAPEVSGAFARVIDRALEFRREDRYENAAAMRADVRRAITEIDAGVTATMPAFHPSGATMVPEEKTIQISEADLERGSSAPRQPGLAAAPPAFGPSAARSEASPDESMPLELARGKAEPTAWPEESINIPRRRSMLPWLALLVLGGVGVKWWLDAQESTARPESEAPSSIVASSSASESPTTPVPDAGRDAPATQLGATAATSAPRPTVVPAASNLRHPLPTNAGPGNVHKVPGHHGR